MKLHATLNVLLDKPKMATKSKHWRYYHEILGLRAHLDSLRAQLLPPPSVVNMQGPEAHNSILGRFYKDYTRGISFLGTPSGKLSKVSSLTSQVDVSNYSLERERHQGDFAQGSRGRKE